MMTEEMALVTLISGVCSAGVTDQTTKYPTKQANTKIDRIEMKSICSPFFLPRTLAGEKGPVEWG